MLRRCIATSTLRSSIALGSAGSISSAYRFGGGAATTHDHSHAFSRSLTEEEQDNLSIQKNRTISSIVPGKAFMRHWVAAEQSTVSVLNRGISVTMACGLILWAGLYATNGFNHQSWFLMSLIVFFAHFIQVHTHMPLLPLFVIPYVAAMMIPA